MISAVIPCYNEPTHIVERTVNAALETLQRFTGQVVLVLDGRTSPLNLSFDERVLVIAKDNGGCASAMNEGISRARWSTIARCDMGDIWFPAFKAGQLDMATVDGRPSFSWSRSETTGVLHKPQPSWQDRVMTDGQWMASTTVFSRSLWKSVGGYDDMLPNCDDWDFDQKTQALLGHKLGWQEYPYETGTATVWPGGLSDVNGDEDKVRRIRLSQKEVRRRGAERARTLQIRNVRP